MGECAGGVDGIWLSDERHVIVPDFIHRLSGQSFGFIAFEFDQGLAQQRTDCLLHRLIPSQGIECSWKT